MALVQTEISSPLRLGRGKQKAGCASILARQELAEHSFWNSAFAAQRKDHRYHEIVEDTICPEFAFRYLLLEGENGRTRAIHPYFLMDHDLAAGAGGAIVAVARLIRRLWPRFLLLRLLMVGSAAGEAHLEARTAGERREEAAILASNILRIAKAEGASIIVMKEFPAVYRDALSCLSACGFAHIPSMPMVRLDISPYGNFEEYLSRGLNSKKRNEFRRKLKSTDKSDPIDMEVVSDIEPIIEEIYPLYNQVYNRAKVKFEKLTKEYFIQISRRLPDRARFFVWRQNGAIIGFALNLVHADKFYGEYLGMDYSRALRIHLYFYMMRDVISWAIANGYRSIISNGLSYSPKRQLGFSLLPLDLYIRHTSLLVNFALKIVLPKLAPVRWDQELKRFPNFSEL